MASLYQTDQVGSLLRPPELTQAQRSPEGRPKGTLTES